MDLQYCILILDVPTNLFRTDMSMCFSKSIHVSSIFIETITSCGHPHSYAHVSKSRCSCTMYLMYFTNKWERQDITEILLKVAYYSF